VRRPGIALAVALVIGGGVVSGARRAHAADADLLNVLLGPEHAGWLIGPISKLASEEEIREYSRLTSDAAAAAFVEDFWERRDPDPARPGNPAREAFEARAVEADRRFSEAGVSGRRTDRGTIFVLYGEPTQVDHEPSPLYGEPPLELWRYARDAAAGLDGERPSDLYRFVKRKDLTVFYLPGRPGRYTNRRPPGAGGAPA
jgi:GWxTD domain-containing protein